MFLRSSGFISTVILSSILSSAAYAEDRAVCERSWQALREDFVVGEFTKYRNTSESKYGEYVTKTVSENKATVMSNTADTVVIKLESSMEGMPPQVSDASYHHDAYIDQCMAHTSEPVPPVVESGNASVTVPYGTFDTQWTRTVRIENDMTLDYKVFMTHLPSGHSLVVKSLSHVKMAYGTSDNESVLVDTNKK